MNESGFLLVFHGPNISKGKGEVKEQSSTSFIYSIHRASAEREGTGSSSLTVILKTTGEIILKIPSSDIL